MKSPLLSALIIIATAALFSGDAGASSSIENLLKLPDGYAPGRQEATYGTYSSVFQSPARPLQNRLVNLENRVMGLSRLANEAPWRQAELVFLLEEALVRLHLDVENAPAEVLTDFEREALALQTVRVYQMIRQHGERLFEDMVRFIDVKIPGPNGLQFRSDTNELADSIYLPNFRSERILSEKERAESYQEKLAEFLKKGGSLSEIQVLDAGRLEQMGGFTRVEYVERQDGKIYVTEGTAGHVLLGGGEPVKSAGQLIFLGTNAGAFSMLIASNSSGNYKPDLLSALFTAKKIAKLANIPYEHIVLTKGEPVSTQAVKVYGKGAGLEKEEINQRLARLENSYRRLLAETARGRPRTCHALFAR